jgi:transcriptional regulator with XRE-family HTH domain
MSKKLGEALRLARKDKKLTQGEVATHLGVTRAAVGQWEAGDNAPSTNNLMKICAYLQIDMASALEGVAQHDMFAGLHVPSNWQNETRQPENHPSSRYSHMRDGSGPIPILKSFPGGKADFLIDDDIIGFAARPIGLEQALGAKAVYMVGTTMEPKFDEGDILFVGTMRTPSIGDSVLVRMQSAEGAPSACYLRQLIARSEGKITLRQFNPSKNITLEIGAIKSIDRIYPWNEVNSG